MFRLISLSLIFSITISHAQLQYQLPEHAFRSAYNFLGDGFTNQVIFSDENPQLNTRVSEAPLYAFAVWPVDKKEALSGKKLKWYIQAIDAGGRHVTLQEESNIIYKAQHPTGSNRSEWLLKSNFTFTPPQISSNAGIAPLPGSWRPEHQPVITENGFNRFVLAELYLNERKLITNIAPVAYNPGTDTISFSTQVLYNTQLVPEIIGPASQTNSLTQFHDLEFLPGTFLSDLSPKALRMLLVSEDSNALSGVSGEISDLYLFSNRDPLRAELSNGASYTYLRPRVPGYVELSAAYTNDGPSQFSTNLLIRQAFLASNAQTQNADASLNPTSLETLSSPYLNASVFVDWRHPNQETNKRPLGVSLPSESDRSDSMQKRQIRFFDEQQTVLIFETNGAYQNLQDSTWTLRWPLPASVDYEQGSYRLSESQLEVYHWDSNNWRLHEDWQISESSATIEVDISESGLYVLASPSAKTIDKSGKVLLSPQPFFYSEDESLHILNLHPETSSLAVYDNSGDKINTINTEELDISALSELSAYQINWFPADSQGRRLSPDYYLLRIETQGEVQWLPFSISD